MGDVGGHEVQLGLGAEFGAVEFVALQLALDPPHGHAQGVLPEVHGQQDLPAVPAPLPDVPGDVVVGRRLQQEDGAAVERPEQSRLESVVAENVHGDSLDEVVPRPDDVVDVDLVLDQRLAEVGRLAHHGGHGVGHGLVDALAHGLELHEHGVGVRAVQFDGRLHDAPVRVSRRHLGSADEGGSVREVWLKH